MAYLITPNGGYMIFNEKTGPIKVERYRFKVGGLEYYIARTDEDLTILIPEKREAYYFIKEVLEELEQDEPIEESILRDPSFLRKLKLGYKYAPIRSLDNVNGEIHDVTEFHPVYINN